MADPVEVYRIELAKDEKALKPIEDKIIELTAIKTRLDELIAEKALLEKNIQSLRWLISTKSDKSEKKDVPVPVQQQPVLFPPKSLVDIYKPIISKFFADKTFKEADLRGIATKDGVLIRGRTISPAYSRGVIRQLFSEGVIDRTDEQGTYRTKAEIISDRIDKAMGTKK